MTIKNVLFIIIFTVFRQTVLSVNIMKDEKIRTICDNFIMICESKNNVVNQDMLLSFTKEYMIGDLSVLINILEQGREVYREELVSLENVMLSNKIALCLTQIIAWLSILGCSHIEQASVLNYSQEERNIRLNGFNEFLNKINGHMDDVNNHLRKMKYNYFTPMSTSFQITVDSAM